MNDGFFPAATRPGVLFGAFAVALVIFDVWLVRLMPLGKIGWKRVDYIWVGAAVLGLFGAATDLRRAVAVGAAVYSANEREAAYREIVTEVKFLSGPAVCRQFNFGSPPPPDFAGVQKEFDRACAYARKLGQELPPTAPPSSDLRIGLRPTFTEPLLLDMFADLDRATVNFIRVDSSYKSRLLARERTDLEWTFAVVWPFLLATALALRIVKVTGEVKLEQ